MDLSWGSHFSPHREPTRQVSDIFAKMDDRYREPWAETWRRRAVTIPLFYLVGTLLIALAPVILLLCLVAALFEKRRLAKLRFMSFLGGYFAGEMLFLLLAALQWLLLAGWTKAGRARLSRATEGLANAWGLVLYTLGRLSFDLTISIEGLDSLKQPGPLIVLLRHASLGDTPLGPTYLGHYFGFRLRYVVKRELINDPVFDVIGTRLGSCFVRRGSKNGGREVEAVCAQLSQMSSRDAIILYPEGTRYSEDKRLKVLEKLRRDNPAIHAKAAQLHHVLPPQLGGPVELLCRNPSADVVICQHVGYEVASSFRDLVDGRAVHQRIEVLFRRIPYAELPKEREAITMWLLDEWKKLDDWVAERKPRVIVPSAPDLSSIALSPETKP